MKSPIKILALIFVVILTLSVSACVQKPEDEVPPQWNGKEEFEISDGAMDENTKALSDRYDAYRKNAQLAFSNATSSAESDFEVSISNGKAKITNYVGESNIVVIPESINGAIVSTVGANAFSQKEVRALYVPDSVTLIEKGALENIQGISTLRLPIIGDGKENNYLGYVFGAVSSDRNSTAVPTSLDMLILGEKVTEISENAFAGCKALSAVILPNSLEKIGKFAFYECEDLVYVELGEAKTVDNYAFGYCKVLFSISFENVERIGMGALYECNSLRELQLPFVGESETENRFIGYIFGAEIADFNDEFVPKSLYMVSVDGCKEIPDRAFAGCLYIGTVYIGNGVECIGKRAFYSCRSLTRVSSVNSSALPDCVKTIDDDAFFGCDNLKTIDLGEGIESIGMQAFYGCRKLEAIVIPQNVTEIKPSTFAMCESLESVTLNNVNKICKDAFWSCDSLKATDCEGIDVEEGNECLTGSLDQE